MQQIQLDEDSFDRKFVHFVKCYLFWLLRFPCYNRKKLTRKIAKLDLSSIPKSEIDTYLGVSGVLNSRRPLALMCSICALYTLKNLVYAAIALIRIDYSNHKAPIELEPILNDNGYPLYWTICVYTNCSQFTRADRDLRYFPLLPWCYPTFNLFFPPTTWLGPYSLLLHLMLAVSMMLQVIALPIYSHNHPIACDTIMFLLAPNLTRQLMSFEAAELHLKLRQSYNLFRGKSWKENPMKRDNFNSRQQQYQPTDLIEIPMDTSAPSGEVEEFGTHCLPRIRSAHWLREGSSRLFRICLIYLTFTQIVSVLLTYDIFSRFFDKATEQERTRDEVIRSRCSQFRVGSDRSLSRMNSDEWLFDFNIFAMLDNLLLVVCVFIILGIMGSYHLMIAELNDWRAELEAKYKLLSELTWLLLNDPGGFVSMIRKMSIIEVVELVETHFKQLRLDTNQTSVRVDDLNETTTRNHSANRGLNCSNRSCLRRSSSMGCVVVDVKPKRSAPNSVQGLERYLILMEKFYISFRLFHLHVKKCASATYPLTFITHGLSFSLICVALWHSRTVKTFSLEHLFVTIANSSLSLTFIVLMSDFHAKVRGPER